MTEVIYTGNAAANTAARGWIPRALHARLATRATATTWRFKWGMHPKGETRRDWSPDERPASTLSVLVSGRFRIELR